MATADNWMDQKQHYQQLHQQWFQTYQLTSTFLGFLQAYDKKFYAQLHDFTSTWDTRPRKNFAGCWPMKDTSLWRTLQPRLWFWGLLTRPQAFTKSSSYLIAPPTPSSNTWSNFGFDPTAFHWKSLWILIHLSEVNFKNDYKALGCLVDHCPAESHYLIGMIERRNSRTILEKLIDTFAIQDVESCATPLVAARHAINSGIHTHGRSAYQAVFGKQPRLLENNFSNPMVLATSSPVAYFQDDIGFRADIVRAEAAKVLQNLDVSQHLRRALLRKTRATKIPDLVPGQPCAFWRWAKRGQKKRGTWVIARFLSWDPSHPGRQAWVKAGATSILVTAKQLRIAFGFEQWTPSEEDIKVLKDVSTNFHQHLLHDEQGPPPPEAAILQDDDVLNQLCVAEPPTMAVPAPQAAAAEMSPLPLPPRASAAADQQPTSPTTVI